MAPSDAGRKGQACIAGPFGFRNVATLRGQGPVRSGLITENARVDRQIKVPESLLLTLLTSANPVPELPELPHR